MRHPIAEQRIVRGATSATISHQFHTADGEPAAPSGAVTVSVVRSDGTPVTTSTVTGSATDPRAVTVAASELATIDRLTATWADAARVVAVRYVDVVSGTVGSVSELKTLETSITAEAAPDVLRARTAAEDRFVSVTGRLPFQRLEVQTLRADGCRLRSAWWPDLVEVRWVRVGASMMSASELATIAAPDPLSLFERSNGWPSCQVDVGYVAGLDHIPDDLRRAFAQATRREITLFNTGVPELSPTFATADGASFGLARPGNGRAYGIDDIDDVFRLYADPRPKVA